MTSILLQLDPNNILGDKKDLVIIELESFYKKEEEMIAKCIDNDIIHKMFLEHRDNLKKIIGTEKLEIIFGSDRDVQYFL